MDDAVIPLAAAFAAATRTDWLALVDKTLKGADIGTLTLTTADGLSVSPLYTAATAAAQPSIRPAPRGDDRAWDIRAIVRHPDPARANDQVLEHLAGGASSLLLRIDPTGADGIALGSAEGLARVLAGVITDLAPIALDAGFHGLACAEWLAASAKASPTAPLAFHLDPLSAFAVAGGSPGPIESHLIAAANLAARLSDTYPKANLFLASGRCLHEAGGPAAWELAFAAAAAVVYAKAMVRAGFSPAAAFAGIVVGVSVDADAPASIVKLRAARAVWDRVTGACGVDAPATIEARSSQRMLTRADPWTNLVRLTSAGFAGAVGGADAVALGSFTDAIGLPDALARRMARNTQLVLMEEAHVGAVADPAAGAWALEAQTDSLARAAWARFNAIESAGGAITAIREGLIFDAVASGRAALQEAVASRALRILGVTDFPDTRPTPPDTEDAAPIAAIAPDPTLPGPDSHCPALVPIRLEEFAA